MISKDCSCQGQAFFCCPGTYQTLLIKVHKTHCYGVFVVTTGHSFNNSGASKTSNSILTNNMRVFERFVFLFLFPIMTKLASFNEEKANFKQIKQSRKTRDTAQSFINVVSHAFCDSSLYAEDKMAKQTLEEVHTYAELKRDPRASLPDSFTVCSTIMTTNCRSNIWPTFFTILDNDRAQFLAPIRNHGTIESLFLILFSKGSSEVEIGQTPPFFPNQWTRSCMSINTTSGSIQWVVEGTLVLTTISEEVKNSKSRPRDLSKKIVLSARSVGGVWLAPSHKVTNLNIFSSLLSIDEMKSVTGGGSCIDEGDYLAWGDMEWILHGQARIETVNQEEPCKNEPFVNLYYTPFPGMSNCMHHCENLGTRVPSVTNFQDWAILQNFLKRELYDKGLNTLRLWLASC